MASRGDVRANFEGGWNFHAFRVAMPQNHVPYLCGIHTGEATWEK
jgi:hypothetical protein